MQVNIERKVAHGLEVFVCVVNGTVAAHFMSLAAARDWAQRFIQRTKQK